MAADQSGGVYFVFVLLFQKVSNLISFKLNKRPRYNLGKHPWRILIKLLKFMLIKLSKFIDDDHLVRASSKMAWGGTRIDKLVSTGNYASTAFHGWGLSKQGGRWRMEH